MFNRSYINGHQNHPHYLTSQQILGLEKKVKISVQDERLVRIVKSLLDPTKLKIYLLLQLVKEISVSDLTYVLDLSQTTASHALADLKNLQLIDCHRCGKLVCYFVKKQKNNQKIAKFLWKKRF